MNAVKKPLNQKDEEGTFVQKKMPGKDQSLRCTSSKLIHDEMTERESRLLFSFSNDIAAVRDKNELLQTIEWKLKKLLGFSYFVIGTINEDRKTFTAFLSDQELKRKDHAYSKTNVQLKNVINEEVLHEILCTPELQIYELDLLAKQQELPVYLKADFESGVKQVAAIRFSNGNEIFGFWMIFYENKCVLDETKSILIKGFANQISTTVLNIIANEKVDGQLIEIDKYRQLLEEEETGAKEEVKILHNYPEIIGASAELQETFRLIGLVAPSDSTVLILGETGTGKELVARAIHNNSQRKGKPIVIVNCAALPANLIESELFGHERGSFTGAVERRTGKFELANNGTLFLDEIGELALDLQVKLLRALQEKEIDRLGGKTPIKVNVRIIAATNRELEKEVQEGRFRSDLYYRLNVFPIHLAPLRNRLEDIPLLASHFVLEHSKKIGRNIKRIRCRVLKELVGYTWPGNVRELEHFIERSILLTFGDTIEEIHLPRLKQNMPIKSGDDTMVIKTIEENERDHILNILRHCKGRLTGKGGAADLLGVPPSTLCSKIKRLNIKREFLKAAE